MMALIMQPCIMLMPNKTFKPKPAPAILPILKASPPKKTRKERKYPNLENEKGRTIYISYGDISPVVKKMSVKEKRFLYDNGVKGAEGFFMQPFKMSSN